MGRAACAARSVRVMVTGMSTWLVVVCGADEVGRHAVASAVAVRLGGAAVLRTDELADALAPQLPGTDPAELRSVAFEASLRSIDGMLHGGNHVVLDDGMPTTGAWERLYELREANGWRLACFSVGPVGASATDDDVVVLDLLEPPSRIDAVMEHLGR